MAVQFVIGRAGSGKTRRCFKAILDALRADPLGPPVYWILPKQATFQAERALVCAAGAFCRARVVSFEQLGRDVFAYAGGNVIPEVTPLGRQMVIGHLLRQLKPRLRFFARGLACDVVGSWLNACWSSERWRSLRSGTPRGPRKIYLISYCPSNPLRWRRVRHSLA